MAIVLAEHPARAAVHLLLGRDPAVAYVHTLERRAQGNERRAPARTAPSRQARRRFRLQEPRTRPAARPTRQFLTNGPPATDRARPCSPSPTFLPAASWTASGSVTCWHEPTSSASCASSAILPGNPGAPGRPADHRRAQAHPPSDAPRVNHAKAAGIYGDMRGRQRQQLRRRGQGAELALREQLPGPWLRRSDRTDAVGLTAGVLRDPADPARTRRVLPNSG